MKPSPSQTEGKADEDDDGIDNEIVTVTSKSGSRRESERGKP